MTREYRSEKRTRVSYVIALHQFGFSHDEIAESSGYNINTIRADSQRIQLLEEYSDRPSKAERLAVVLLHYAKLVTKVVINDSLPNLEAMLGRWLRINEVIAFISGVRVHEKLMANPLLADEDLPYLELLKDLFGVTFPDPKKNLSIQRSKEYIDKYIIELAEGKRQPPKSFPDFYIDVMYFVEAPTDTWVVGPFWTVSATTLIDNVLKTLTMQEQHVLRMYYGLSGDESLKFHQIGITMNYSGGARAQQIHAKAMGKLRHPSRVEKLERYVKLLDGNELAKHDDEVRELKGVIAAQAKTICALSKEMEEKSRSQLPLEKFIDNDLLIPALAASVERLDLSVRAKSCMDNMGIRHVHELVVRTESDFLERKNFAQGSLNVVRDALDELSLHFGVQLNLGMRLDPNLVSRAKTLCNRA